jgi:hypothetical protein
METAQAYLIEAGWIFFGAWGMVLLVLVVLAFGRDLLPSGKRHGSNLTSR